MRIRYQPLGNYTNPTTTTYVRSGQFASFQGVTNVGTGTADNSMRAQLDYLNFDPAKPFNRYIRVWKHLKNVLGVKWLLTNSYPTGPAEASSLLRVSVAGFSDEALMATMSVTYYVQFRQLKP